MTTGEEQKNLISIELLMPVASSLVAYDLMIFVVVLESLLVSGGSQYAMPC